MSMVSNASPLINFGWIGRLSALRELFGAVKSHRDALRGVAGFRVSDALYMRVLQSEGEI